MVHHGMKTNESQNIKTQDVLAAGSALGRAGQWKGCRSFLENSTTESLANYRSAIYAAILKACYICGKYEDVLENCLRLLVTIFCNI